jgi:TRAP-type C4-dicarboxylate transport system permease small subunit
MIPRNDTDASPAHPPGQPPAETVPDVETLFEEWQAQESHVDLSDLRWIDAFVFVVFWALFAVVFLQFYTRYVLNSSLGWTEEIARYLLIGVTFIGSMTAMRKGSHIAVEALLVFLPERGKHWVLVVVDGLVALFCVAMAWYAYRLGALAPGYMVSIDIPKGYMYWIVAAALAGITVYAALRFVRRLRGREAAVTHGLTLD